MWGDHLCNIGGIEFNNKLTKNDIKDHLTPIIIYDNFTGKVKIIFSKAGRYEFGKMYISAMSTELFDKYAKERCESVYEVSDRTSTRVTGTLNAKSDGWLYLSIPVNTNWNVYIDGGQVAEIHNANIAFFATPVTKGEHTVEMRYDHRNRNIALAVSGTGLLLLIALGIIDKKRLGKTKKENSLETA